MLVYAFFTFVTAQLAVCTENSSSNVTDAILAKASLLPEKNLDISSPVLPPTATELDRKSRITQANGDSTTVTFSGNDAERIKGEAESSSKRDGKSINFDEPATNNINRLNSSLVRSYAPNWPTGKGEGYWSFIPIIQGSNSRRGKSATLPERLFETSGTTRYFGIDACIHSILVSLIVYIHV